MAQTSNDQSIASLVKDSLVNFFRRIHWFLPIIIVSSTMIAYLSFLFLSKHVIGDIEQEKMMEFMLTQMGVKWLCDVIFDPVIIVLAMLTTKAGSTFQDVKKSTPSLYIKLLFPYLIWLSIVTIGSPLIFPSILFACFSMAVINPIDWLEGKKKAFKSLSPPRLSFLPTALLYCVFAIVSQFAVLFIFAYANNPMISFATAFGEKLIWALTIMFACQFWRHTSNTSPKASP